MEVSFFINLFFVAIFSSLVFCNGILSSKKYFSGSGSADFESFKSAEHLDIFGAKERQQFLGGQLEGDFEASSLTNREDESAESEFFENSFGRGSARRIEKINKDSRFKPLVGNELLVAAPADDSFESSADEAVSTKNNNEPKLQPTNYSHQTKSISNSSNKLSGIHPGIVQQTAASTNNLLSAIDPILVALSGVKGFRSATGSRPFGSNSIAFQQQQQQPAIPLQQALQQQLFGQLTSSFTVPALGPGNTLPIEPSGSPKISEDAIGSIIKSPFQQLTAEEGKANGDPVGSNFYFEQLAGLQQLAGASSLVEPQPPAVGGAAAEIQQQQLKDILDKIMQRQFPSGSGSAQRQQKNAKAAASLASANKDIGRKEVLAEVGTTTRRHGSTNASPGRPMGNSAFSDAFSEPTHAQLPSTALTTTFSLGRGVAKTLSNRGRGAFSAGGKPQNSYGLPQQLRTLIHRPQPAFVLSPSSINKENTNFLTPLNKIDLLPAEGNFSVQQQQQFIFQSLLKQQAKLLEILEQQTRINEQFQNRAAAQAPAQTPAFRAAAGLASFPQQQRLAALSSGSGSGGSGGGVVISLGPTQQQLSFPAAASWNNNNNPLSPQQPLFVGENVLTLLRQQQQLIAPDQQQQGDGLISSNMGYNSAAATVEHPLLPSRESKSSSFPATFLVFAAPTLSAGSVGDEKLQPTAFSERPSAVGIQPPADNSGHLVGGRGQQKQSFPSLNSILELISRQLNSIDRLQKGRGGSGGLGEPSPPSSSSSSSASIQFSPDVTRIRIRSEQNEEPEKPENPNKLEEGNQKDSSKNDEKQRASQPSSNEAAGDEAKRKEKLFKSGNSDENSLEKTESESFGQQQSQTSAVDS